LGECTWHREREKHVKVKGNREIKGREIIKGKRGRNGQEK